MHIIGINGAPEKGGSVTGLLSEALCAATKEGMALGIEAVGAVRIETVHLIDLKMPFHNGSLTDIPRELQGVFRQMRMADGLIFATPANWYNVSALMKCFLDWMTSLEDRFELEGKVAGILVHCNCDGGNQAAMSLAGPLLHMGMMLPPYSAFYRNKNVGERSEDGWQMTDQVLVGQNVARLIAAVRHSKRGWQLR